MDLAELKLYLRVENDEDDLFIQALQQAAIEYLKNAGVDQSDNALYVLAVQLLVAHWYENRQAVIIGQVSKQLEYSLQAILTQLMYAPEAVQP